MTRVAKKTATQAPAKHAGVQGLKDIVTQTSPLWNVILKRFQKLGRIYGFQRVETPLLEELAVLENYYKDNHSAVRPLTIEGDGRPLALRAAILPSLLRAYVQYKVADDR